MATRPNQTTPVDMPPKRLYSVEEAAASLSISRTAAYELIRSEALRSVKVRKRRLVPATALDEFVAALIDAS